MMDSLRFLHLGCGEALRSRIVARGRPALHRQATPARVQDARRSTAQRAVRRAPRVTDT